MARQEHPPSQARAVVAAAKSGLDLPELLEEARTIADPYHSALAMASIAGMARLDQGDANRAIDDLLAKLRKVPEGWRRAEVLGEIAQRLGERVARAESDLVQIARQVPVEASLVAATGLAPRLSTESLLGLADLIRGPDLVAVGKPIVHAAGKHGDAGGWVERLSAFDPATRARLLATLHQTHRRAGHGGTGLAPVVAALNELPAPLRLETLRSIVQATDDVDDLSVLHAGRGQFPPALEVRAITAIAAKADRIGRAGQANAWLTQAIGIAQALEPADGARENLAEALRRMKRNDEADTLAPPRKPAVPRIEAHTSPSSAATPPVATPEPAPSLATPPPEVASAEAPIHVTVLRPDSRGDVVAPAQPGAHLTAIGTQEPSFTRDRAPAPSQSMEALRVPEPAVVNRVRGQPEASATQAAEALAVPEPSVINRDRREGSKTPWPEASADVVATARVAATPQPAGEAALQSASTTAPLLAQSRRPILALYNAYDGGLKPVHLQMLARAAPLALAFDFDVLLIGYPSNDLAALANQAARETQIGDGNNLVNQLLREHRIALVGKEHHLHPNMWNVPAAFVALTQNPEQSKACDLRALLAGPDRVGLIMGLGSRGLPPQLLRATPLHYELTGRNVPLETSTVMGIVAERLRALRA